MAQHRPPARAEIRVEYLMGTARGAGTLSAISKKGAIIETSQGLPHAGSLVWLVVFLDKGCTLRIPGRAAGLRSGGFEIEFDSTPPELIGLINDMERARR